MIHQKKKKNKASFGFFGRFRNVLAVSGLFRPYWPAADTTRYGRYGPILAESARFGMNRAASARIKPSQRESEKKKKKRRCGPTHGQPHRTPRPASGRV